MKGILKTFEVVIALSTIMISFIVLYSNPDPLPEFETVSWKGTGINALHSLDSSNLLRFDALNNNTAAIEARIDPLLPPNVDQMVQVCENNCSVPSIVSDKVASVSYLLSGDSNNSTAREVILYMWSNE